MPSSDTTHTPEYFGLPELADGVFFGSAAQVISEPRLNGQSHYMRRAFEEMELDGILCVDDQPTVYLKDFESPVSRRQVNELQRKFWNQGTGTILVIQDPARLYIFSGMLPPSNGEGPVDKHSAFVESLNRVSQTLEAHRFVERVASGHYYRSHPQAFQANNAVDQFLLDNLGCVGELLRHDDTPAERKRVHSLLGRVIFTCYLIDRRIIELPGYSFIRRKGVEKLVDLFRGYPPDAAIDLLYKLFEQLRSDFNGSMFDDDLDTERGSVTPVDIDVLRRFLEGEQLDSRQRTLGFWAYDFSVIPVETISAIYEKFLEEEDAEKKEATGAFYTPKHLTEMVVSEAVDGFPSLLDKRYLDPACGSGIFLVILFNRLAEEWRRRNPTAQQKKKARELLDILTTRICGVDVNRTACRIACFSLYIAFLDQFDPPTLREFQEKTKRFLPKLLAYRDDNYQNTETPVIFEGNFFEPKLPIGFEFDVVVGNPPWVGRNQAADEDAEKWALGESNPFLDFAPKGKTNRKAAFLPQRQLAHAFLWKAPVHLKAEGTASFLLPSEVLLNQTDEFQQAWFRRFRADRVLHLADYRKFLFTGATRPCFIATYRKIEPAPATQRIEYAVPKVRRQDPRSGLIPVLAEDRKWLSLQELLDEAAMGKAAVMWKKHLWGTERDVRFLDYLLQLDKLDDIAGEPESGKRWIKGQGFQPWYQFGYDRSPDTYGEPKPIPGQLSDPFLKTVDDNLQMFVLPNDCGSLEQRLTTLRCKGAPEFTPDEKLMASLKGFRRSPDARLFDRPLVVVNKGFTKFAFVDFHAFYQHSLTGIHGSNDDADLLRFFAVYAKSRLAAYFSFHTAGSWGTERDEVRVHELMRLPFPLPGRPGTSADADAIVKDVANRMRCLQQEFGRLYAEAKRESNGEVDFALRSKSLAQTRRDRVEQLQRELEPLVYRYFDLSEEEIILIEDAHQVYEQSHTPSSPDKKIRTLDQTTPDDRLIYSRLLIETLNEWARKDQPRGHRQPYFFNAEISPCTTIGMALVTLRKATEEADCREVPANGRLEIALAQIARNSSTERGPFEYLRGIIMGDRNAIRILKPDLLGCWTRTAALNDADSIFHAIVQSKRGSR